MNNGRYILNAQGEPEPCEDLLTWGRWMQKRDIRRVALDEVGDAKVSTVFLGLDHSFGTGGPLLFETMVFNGPMDGEQDRYSTRGQAEAGHAAILARVKAAAKVGAYEERQA